MRLALAWLPLRLAAPRERFLGEFELPRYSNYFGPADAVVNATVVYVADLERLCHELPGVAGTVVAAGDSPGGTVASCSMDEVYVNVARSGAAAMLHMSDLFGSLPPPCSLGGTHR